MKRRAEIVERKRKERKKEERKKDTKLSRLTFATSHFLSSLRLPWTRIGAWINDDLP